MSLVNVLGRGTPGRHISIAHKEYTRGRGGRHTHAVSLLRPQPQEIADVIRRLNALSSQEAAFASPGGRCTALYPATGYAKGRAPKLNSHLSPACVAFASVLAIAANCHQG